MEEDRQDASSLDQNSENLEDEENEDDSREEE